jgi:hypothetical protein
LISHGGEEVEEKNKEDSIKYLNQTKTNRQKYFDKCLLGLPDDITQEMLAKTLHENFSSAVKLRMGITGKTFSIPDGGEPGAPVRNHD